MRCVLGVDNGGSKSDALLVRDDGIVLGHGYVDYRDPASGRSALGSGRSVASVSRAIAQAFGDYSCDELYFSSVSKTNPDEVMPDNRFKHLQCDFIYEAAPALALVGAEAGIVVLAGTGAMVHVQTREGAGGRFDGMGPLMGDFGSGYYIGQLALHAVSRAVIHPRHTTMLSEMVPAHFGFQDEKYPIASLIKFTLGNPDRAEIAGLARLVNTAADAGDRVAIELLHEAAAAMAVTVCDAIDRMGITDDAYPLVATGSIATHSRIYWEHLSALVLDFAPRFTPMRPEFPPVVGVALIALRKLAAVDPDLLQQNLFRTARTAMGMQS